MSTATIERTTLDKTTIHGADGAPAVAWYRQPDFEGQQYWEAASADDSLDSLWRSLGPRWKPAGDLERQLADTPDGVLTYWTAGGDLVEITH